LNNSIREKKDKFTIVMVDPSMLAEIKSIKQQYPKTIFALWNKDRREILPADRQNISF
jgi:basic membrane lipoprotein Med (substrate-binding protein (PBP1-ABC) superfamily)